jgi:ABC-type glycerol-3-phosphate transport system permease component
VILAVALDPALNVTHHVPGVDWAGVNRPAVTSTDKMTVPLGLATFQGTHATEWTLLMAGKVMSLTAMLVIFFAAQRYFIRSVAAGGLAGT